MEPQLLMASIVNETTKTVLQDKLGKGRSNGKEEHLGGLVENLFITQILKEVW